MRMRGEELDLLWLAVFREGEVFLRQSCDNMPLGIADDNIHID